MLAIKAWKIYYADKSTFDSTQGTWAEAPPFGVECIVYYHVPPYKTIDIGGSADGDKSGSEGIFYWLGEGEKKGFKMGLWMDDEGYYRIMKLAQKSVIPQ